MVVETENRQLTFSNVSDVAGNTSSEDTAKKAFICNLKN